jgi:radical SAM superfamily enzyme YgiQ (UPF0313 family)
MAVEHTPSSRPSSLWKVALVGRRLTDNENLGLGYLAAALEEAGFGHERFELNQAADVGQVAEAILQGGFELVGLSIPDGGSAYLPLAFGELLRRRGFGKPITGGGSFATLARHWLLERYPWLHSVVRFAGEVPLVRLARALREGSDVAAVPGLTTRADDGPPAPVLDDKPMGLRPVRGELPEILGHRAAHLLATRGCAGRCGYCAPAALQSQEQKEGIRAGVRLEILHQAGVGHVRRRSVEDLCDEMATLWHDQGVRYFYYVDEHMLPYQESEALAYLEGMRRGLRRRKVGRLGIGTMLRADRLTRDIVRAFAEVGLLRAFVGIEFASAEDGRHFGRPSDPTHARDMLAACEAAGVVAVSNMMMLHPYSSRRSIIDTVRFMEDAPTGVFEVTDMRVYHGTALWHRMAREGRLVGNPLRYSYSFLDPVVQRFAEIFSRLRAESFWNHSIAFRTQDAFLACALARRLRPRLSFAGCPSEMDEIRDQVVSLYTESYWKALALAEAEVEGYEAAPLVAEARRRSLRLQERLDRLAQGLAHQLRVAPQVFSPSRAAAASAIAFTILGGSPVGCQSSSHARDAGDASVVADSGRGSPEKADASLDLQCPAAMELEEQQQHRDKALQAAPCFNGEISYYPPSVSVRSTIPLAPGATVSDWCVGSIGTADAGGTFNENRAQWEAQVKNAIADLDHSCIGETHRYQSVHVEGGMGVQAQQIWGVGAGCGLADYHGFTVTLDGDGRVAGVSGLSADVADCMLSALKDLVFPCLAGASLCEAFILE